MAVLLVLLFILVPIVEIYLIIQVGQVIGPWWTIAVLVGLSVFGSYLIKREGRRAWQALQAAVSGGRLPDRELLDGALVLVGGTLLLTPGFMTDVFGLFLVLPFTRPLARGVARRMIRRRVEAAVARGATGYGFPPGAGGTPNGNDRSGATGQVIQGEVLDDDKRP
ncbi:FxsA family protein [Flindersiella endophytica]